MIRIRGVAFTDAHVMPEQHMDHFHVLGDFIGVDEPEIIWQGGDFASMNSFSHWDKDKRLLIEGRRIQKDLEAARNAWKIVEYYIAARQRALRKQKKRVWKPKLIWHLGNHEDWIPQYIQRHPELEGYFDFIQAMDFNPNLYSEIVVVPYKTVWACGGVLFSHVPLNRMGPINSKYIAARALADYTNAPLIFGHTHRKTVDSIARLNEKGELETIRSISMGCFFKETPEYTQHHNNDFWQGIHSFELLGNGVIDLEEICMERLLNGWW